MYKHLYIYLLLMIAALAGGCSLVEEPGKACGSGAGDISISFKMIAETPITRSGSPLLTGTRADSQHNEADSELISLEDGIDLNDLGIFVFARPEGATNPDGTPADEKLLLKTTTLGQSTDPTMMITGSPGSYTVTMVFKREVLHAALGMEITQDASKRVEFRIVIVANSTSPGTNAQAKWNLINGDTYAKVIEQLSDKATGAYGTYAMSYLYNKDYTGTDALGIYSNRKKNIPMFGTNTFFATHEALYDSRPDDRVNLGVINMLRALAKIRVVDNIQNKEANGYPKIIAAEYVGTQSMACQLPYEALTYQDGYQVHTPNIAQTENAFNPNEESRTFRLGTIPDANTMTPAGQRKGTTFIGFVPEQKIDYLNGNVNEGQPIIRITAQLTDDPTRIRQYEVPMKGTYDGQTMSFGNDILRNHIFTLSVNKVAVGTPVEITVEVADWTSSEFTLDYDNILVFPQKVEWQSGFQSVDETNGYVYVQEWTTNADGEQQPVPMVCTFRFESPKGATWQAEFVGGDNGAFQFADKDGNIIGTNVVEGNINNTVQRLYIVTTNPKPEDDSRAAMTRLQFVVRMLDGSIIEAHSANGDFQDWTLVQNP